MMFNIRASFPLIFFVVKDPQNAWCSGAHTIMRTLEGAFSFAFPMREARQ
jgi:hypothetical protein